MSNRNRGLHFAIFLVAAFFSGATVYAAQKEPPPAAPICASQLSPYRDFDFIIGDWDFFSPDGKKIGEHLYSKREQGCLILEEWSSAHGATGTGMNFVDPATGLWRQVWMSPLFHIDYSGGLNDVDAMVLEGRIYPNSGGESAPVRGIWTKQDDGSVKQEFLKFNDATGAWELFFVGFSRAKQK